MSDLVHHSDRGLHFLSLRYTARLAEAGIERSMGSVGAADTMSPEVDGLLVFLLLPILPYLRVAYDPELPMDWTLHEAGYQGVYGLEQPRSRCWLSQTENGDPRISGGWEPEHVREIEIQGHQAALLACTHLYELFVGRAAQALLAHEHRVMSRLYQNVTDGWSEVLIKLELQVRVVTGTPK